MKKIDNKKLEKITGGEVSILACLAITSVVVFIIGIIDGYVHPKSCNNT